MKLIYDRPRIIDTFGVRHRLPASSWLITGMRGETPREEKRSAEQTSRAVEKAASSSRARVHVCVCVVYIFQQTDRMKTTW